MLVSQSFLLWFDRNFLTAGFAGPMFFAPMSELYGRKVIYVSTLLVGLVFIIPGAVAKNIGTLLVARAIDGIGFRCVFMLLRLLRNLIKST